MKVSLNWLKDFVEFDPKLTVEDIKWRLTEASAEIEKIHHVGEGLETVVVGELMKTKKHPDAEKLFVAEVMIAPKKTIQVIYGDKAEVAIGDKVPTAIAPTKLHAGEVKKGKIRGEMSEGMLCLDSELLEGMTGTLTKFDKKTKIGTPIGELLPVEDYVFEIDNHSITHRPDLFSIYGFARECVALGIAKWKYQYPDYDLKKMTGKETMPFSVKFDKKFVSNYNSTCVDGLDSRPAPFWMQAKLTACGIRGINALVDITNYVMLEAGAPMHAFDKDAMPGNEFLFRLSEDGEAMNTLDGKTQKLFDGVMVVENDKKIVDLVGIMGGENSEVTDSTKSVYYHQGIYDPVLIRKAMIGLGHRTDAGTIYEKGPHPELSEVGLGRSLELTKEIFPDATFQYELYTLKNFDDAKQTVEVSYEKMDRHLGIEIDRKKAAQILTDLGCEVSSSKTGMKVTIPPWRRESLQVDVDIIEEVARINGYSNVPANPPPVELVPPTKNHKRHTKRTVQSYLISQGFLEEANFSFLSEDLLSKVGITDHSQVIELANPVSDDFRFMRPSCLSYMLRNLGRNQIYRHQTWKTFEMGSTFSRVEEEVSERHQLMMLIATPDKSEIFFQAKGVVEGLFRELSLDHQLVAGENDNSYPGKCVDIKAGEITVGQVYELHPMIADNFKLRGAAAVVAIGLSELYQVQPESVFYSQLNRNPEALLDINVVVDSDTMMSEVEAIIRSVEADYLHQAELIDVYEGENLGKDKKSFTFALSYLHPERTLEEKEIQDILDKLIKALEKSGGVVRR